MSEVDEMKKRIDDHRRAWLAAEKRLTLAIAEVDQTRKEKRDKSSRPK